MKLWKPGQGRVFLSRGESPAQGARSWSKVLAGLMLALCAFPALLVRPDACAAAQAAQQQAREKALYGQSWAFGQSEDRKAAIWRRGVPAQSLKQKAVTGTGAARAGAGQGAGSGKGTASGKTAPDARGAAGRGAPDNGAVDTGDAIERALSAAEAASRAEEAKAATAHKPKGSLGLSMKDATTTWNVTPMRESMRPDEVLVRDRQHVVRAFADVEPTDDLSIRVGPELILKDEQHAAESAGASQPDSALGLGMQFKLDF